jgi:hypothetical protein
MSKPYEAAFPFGQRGRDEETEPDLKKTANLLRKHGGMTGVELKAKGK